MPNKLNASPLAAETSRKEAVRVSDDVACQVVNQEGSLISRVDVAGDLPVPWILRRMEKYLVASGSRFLCEMPPAQRAPPVSSSLSPARIPGCMECQGSEGPICCPNLRPTTSRQGRRFVLQDAGGGWGLCHPELKECVPYGAPRPAPHPLCR